MKVGTRKTGLNPTVSIIGRPNAVLPLRFHLFYDRAAKFKCFNFNTSVDPVY